MLESIKKYLDEKLECELLKFTPHWQDACHHKPEEYVCSVWAWHGNASRWHDVYVFRNGHSQSVCLRGGNDGGDYASPGQLGEFIRTCGCHGNKLPHYEAAREMLMLLGHAEWKRDYKNDGSKAE